jgi:acyl-coenzyme A synthetase/AMP-(fatty) acid ligase
MSLPIHYSYGLSVLNSHLYAGASIALTGHTLIKREFWKDFSDTGCTSFAGVPYAYEILHRTGFENLTLPKLRTMTQAGGRLPLPLAEKFHHLLREQGARLVVMYGQTEATARISWVPPADLLSKLGSIGKSIPGGNLSVTDRELVYSGPNVMMGYAEGFGDLEKGDELGGVLHTGDLGHRDGDGFFFVTGRTKRISKVYGLRINLDELEVRLRSTGPIAVIGTDQKIYVFSEEGERADHLRQRQELATLLGLNINTFEFRKVPRLPLKVSGKIDYEALQGEVNGS